MKKIMIILALVLICFSLFTGCTNQKDGGDQDTNLGNSVEVDDTDIASADADIDTNAKSSTETLPNGFTYSFKDPDNADGIVVTPRE